MPTDQRDADDPIEDQLRRMSDAVCDLSARIARLASYLGVNLESEAELERVLHSDAAQAKAPVPDRSVTPDRRTAPRNGMTADRRKSHLHEELRGLLVLRYGVARSYVQRVGVDAARHILVMAQEQLVREGFRDGADGADLKRLFDYD